MRRKRLILVAALCGASMLAVFGSCSNANAPTNFVHDWSSWETTTEAELNYPIPGHMDNYREIYINEAGEKVKTTTVEGKLRYDYPAGTIIAKEIYKGQNHKEGDKPFQVTAMVKAPDDPRAQGGWIWVVKDMASGTETVLTDEFCITCHANANEQHPYGDQNTNGEFRDYVYFPYKSDEAKAAETSEASAKPEASSKPGVSGKPTASAKPLPTSKS